MPEVALNWTQKWNAYCVTYISDPKKGEIQVSLLLDFAGGMSEVFAVITAPSHWTTFAEEVASVFQLRGVEEINAGHIMRWVKAITLALLQTSKRKVKLILHEIDAEEAWFLIEAEIFTREYEQSKKKKRGK